MRLKQKPTNLVSHYLIKFITSPSFYTLPKLTIHFTAPLAMQVAQPKLFCHFKTLHSKNEQYVSNSP